MSPDCSRFGLFPLFQFFTPTYLIIPSLTEQGTIIELPDTHKFPPRQQMSFALLLLVSSSIVEVRPHLIPYHTRYISFPF